jgi:hypothetical protein
MKRRQFITVVAGAALAWPLNMRAQESKRKRRIGFLDDYYDADPERSRLLAAFRDALQKLDGTEGRNRLSSRWRW